MTVLTQEATRRRSSRPSPDEIEAILISEWPVKRGEIIRVAIKNYKGTWLLDIRKFFENEAGEYNPTSKGISLGLKHLNRVNAAAADALAVARLRGIIPADHGGEQ
jgi:hypothetical protein